MQDIKKWIAKGMVGMLSISAMVVGVFGMGDNIASNSARYAAPTEVAVSAVADAVTVPSTYALTSSGGTVNIETTDLTNVDTSVNNLLKTVFEVLKLLPFMALILGGFYLLDKLFAILPHPGGKK